MPHIHVLSHTHTHQDTVLGVLGQERHGIHKIKCKLHIKCTKIKVIYLCNYLFNSLFWVMVRFMGVLIYILFYVRLSDFTFCSVKTKHEGWSPSFYRIEINTPTDLSTVVDYPREMVKGFSIFRE